MMALASKYFKPEKTGRKSTRVSKGDTFNYKGNIYFIISEPKEYIDSDGYLVVYCRIKYYDYRNGKEMKGYGVETLMRTRCW